MLTKSFLSTAAAVLFAGASVHAQSNVIVDKDTGITYNNYWQGQTYINGEFGIAFPSNSAANECLIRVVGSLDSGYYALGFGGNAMLKTLIPVHWYYNGTVYSQFRYALQQQLPALYNGTATFSPLSLTKNSTHWKFQYRCSSIDPTASYVQMQYAWGKSIASVSNPASANSDFSQHDFASEFAFLNDAPKYSTTPTPTKGNFPTATYQAAAYERPPVTSHNAVPTGTTYDYVVVGGGAAGLVVSSRLAQYGASVLLIERGPASTYASGGRPTDTYWDQPSWIGGTNLTRFDIPGECNQIWHDAGGISCEDISTMEGCVLGGGTAINAGMYYKPVDQDFDQGWPTGWKSKDIKAATDRLFSVIPGTETTSSDGKLYKTDVSYSIWMLRNKMRTSADLFSQNYDLITPALAAAGWRQVHDNEEPNAKNLTYAHPTYMFQNGIRFGPMDSYFVTAMKLPNFHYWLNTDVQYVTRNNDTITGVVVKAYRNGGYTGTVPVKSTGRVILSAGTFGSAKILFRSSIGPYDMLDALSNLPTENILPEDQRIYLPVGYNIIDHTNTDLMINSSSIATYDFVGTWDNNPQNFQNYTGESLAGNQADQQTYLKSRSGVLATAAPAPNLVFWQRITGSDGISRAIHWTSRIEGTLGLWPQEHSVCLSMYLGNGKQARGRITIDVGSENLLMSVTQTPYDNDADNEVIIKAAQQVIDIVSTIKTIEWVFPPKSSSAKNVPAISASDFVLKPLPGANVPANAGNHNTNHWLGSAKMGTDDGRANGGYYGSVVDLNTQVYGTKNLFVVDGSIFPDISTTNPSGPIMVVAERAAEILYNLGRTTTTTTTTTTTKSSTCQLTTVTPTVTRTITPTGKNINFFCS
ncbi:hypothetical protein HDV00_004173 [Rhizophlyctis rosea]|nr:hypothetical protein HDV00_004173 [Rhizophlyctis rosea]